ncbi:MAG: hypothetical protein AAGA75_00210 [Cyanobacteria bacterium P01_E01_bin.6]
MTTVKEEIKMMSKKGDRPFCSSSDHDRSMNLQHWLRHWLRHWL